MHKEWQALIKREPLLLDLFRAAQSIKDDGRRKYPFDEIKVWYLEFKPILIDLVGHARKDDPVLRTCRAYEVAYEIIANEVDRQIHKELLKGKRRGKSS
jgi:hypothetical protein